MLTLRCVEWLACNQADAKSAVILQRFALASMRPLEGATKTSDSFQVISRSEHGAIALLDPPVGEQGQTPRRPSVDGALVKALRIKMALLPPTRAFGKSALAFALPRLLRLRLGRCGADNRR